MWQRFPCPLEGWDHDHEDDSCLVCTLRAELAALRGKLERTVGYWNDTRAERGEYMERADKAEAREAQARALLARVSDSSYENISLNRAWVIDEEVVEDVRDFLAGGPAPPEPDDGD